MTPLVLPSDSAVATEAFAACLAQHCKGQSLVIYLSGELGAGKTTFCRGFLHGLGHKGIVKSPTYTIVEPYELSGLEAYHFDLYRINSDDELEAMGIRDYFNKHSLCLIEWPERADNALAKPDISIQLVYVSKERKLTISVFTESGESILHGFKQSCSLTE